VVLLLMPSSWLIGMIKPIYKNKGDKFNPNNYRPITIVSCLGKLFTAILNERLTEFSESFSVLCENYPKICRCLLTFSILQYLIRFIFYPTM
jgi:hypothetical protein